MSHATVRAKFRLDRFEATQYRPSLRKPDGSYEQGEPVELRTLIFLPVYSNDPGSENARFWSATPTPGRTSSSARSTTWILLRRRPPSSTAAPPPAAGARRAAARRGRSPADRRLPAGALAPDIGLV